MQTNKIMAFAFILALPFFGSAQRDPDVKHINKSLKTKSVSTFFTSKKDTVYQDYTNGLRDDPTLYNSSGLDRQGSGDSVRLIYFLHGLGGDETSWLSTYKAHTDEYRYKPYKPDYFGNQYSFDNASDEAHNEMGVKLLLYKQEFPSRFDTIAKPYVIAHSLGGLISRDIDMKYDSADLIDRNLYPGNRRFWGLVTFGTPHSGAHIVGNQRELAQLGGDFTGVILKLQTDVSFGRLKVKLPLFTNLQNRVTESVEDVIILIRDSLAPLLLTQFTKDQTDPIGKQFTPTSTYLVDTLNQYSNPKLAKALFWGEEEDPILWRMAYYALGEGPNSYPQFGANEDSKLANTMEDMRLKFVTKKTVNRGHANWQKSKVKRIESIPFWNYGAVLRTARRIHLNKYYAYNSMALSYGSAAHQLSTMNLRYKYIIGALDENNFILDSTYAGCKKNTVFKTYNVNTNQLLSTNYYSQSSGLLSPMTWDPSLCGHSTSTTTFALQYRFETTISYVPVYKYSKTLIETPSDATVLAPSAKAFPGCLEIYKNFMGPAPLPGGGMSRGRVNHLQMRNCAETDVALRKIYKGNNVDMPSFFRLHKW